MAETKVKISQDKVSESSSEKADGKEDSGLRLRVGDSLQIELLTDIGQSQAQRYAVKVIGYHTGKSIIITTPTTGDKVVLLRVGQLVNVRLFGAKRLIGFRSSILRTLFVPYPYLHLSYPQELSSVELRRNQRIPVQAICAVKNDSHPGTDPIPAVIVDLSVSGALVESPKPLGALGNTIAIATRLSVARSERYLSLPGVIRSVQLMEKNTPPVHQYGIEFQTMSPDTSLVLHGFVYEQIVISYTGDD